MKEKSENEIKDDLENLDDICHSKKSRREKSRKRFFYFSYIQLLPKYPKKLKV